jgi:hypothetical protein
VRAYLAELNAFVERDRAQQERAAAEAAREKLVSLDVRLGRLLASIPPKVQAEGLSLMSLQAQLRARGRGHTRCHIGELGGALRRMGWRRLRRWNKSADGFCALWFPPSN